MDVRIAELNLYPVKGCRGIGFEEARLVEAGLESDGVGDREWVVVDAEGRALTQREHPRMARVETRLTPTALLLRAPGMLLLEVPLDSEGDVVEVQVWDDKLTGVTQGEIADLWFSNYLGAATRLMRFDYQVRRLATRSYTGEIDAPVKFADAFPLLITSTASLAEVNARLGRQGYEPVTMARFRPNIVLDGLPPFEEDYAKLLRIGSIAVQPVKPCVRCTVPGVDPVSGEYSSLLPDVLAGMRGGSSGVTFGINAIVVEGAGGECRTDQPVQVELRF